MSEGICIDGIAFIERLFQEDKDPFIPSSWYSLDGRFEFVSSRARRYQIGWQSSIGVRFLQSFETSRAVFARDQLLAVVREYDFARYEDILQNVYKGSFGVSSV